MAEPFADPNIVIFGKLILAALLGMAIGTERAVVGKRAGTRTFALVALGSCLLILVSTGANLAYLGHVDFDPMRVAAGIVTGIGFLGAGLIIVQRETVQGLTTAAGLWVSAAIGIAVGFGMYTVSIFTTVIILIIFTVFWSVENWMKRTFSLKQNPQDDVPKEGDAVV